MRIGDNDRAIVRYVYDYRVLSQEQIERLLERSKPTVQRLLRRLYDHRYLERVFLPITHFGSSPALYIVDQKGIELLRQIGVEDFTGVPTRNLSSMYLDHTLAINEFRIAFTQACEGIGWRISKWITENEIKADYDRVRVPGRRRPVALVPDSYFSVTAPEKGTTHFFLELDRGTMPLKRFREKVAAYTAYYQSGDYNRRYNARGFRVLTVVDGVGQGRVDNLADTSANIPSIGRRFWFAHLPAVTTKTVLSSPIWRVAGSDQPTVLFNV